MRVLVREEARLLLDVLPELLLPGGELAAMRVAIRHG
jgi:hypothetical protein